MLLLTALTTSLLYQMLGNYRIAVERVEEKTQVLREGGMLESWMRVSVAGLVADAKSPFEGDAHGFRGVSGNALMGIGGGGDLIAWSVQAPGDGETFMAYEQEGRGRFALPFLEMQEPYFAYLDAEGKTHERWPPAKGLYSQLPEMVLLLDEPGSPRLQLGMSIGGPRDPQPFTPIEIEQGD
ncbi:MAG: hypothetical protein HYV16_15995 [Gammaproteobacteria bacterium]|nr:hypothetical protein [Gammaproteobacteria bacterium]